jgi:hypothetical protein
VGTTDEGDRIGNFFQMKRIKINLELGTPASQTTDLVSDWSTGSSAKDASTRRHRIVLVYSRCAGSIAWSDIFKSTGTGVPSDPTKQYRNLDKVGEYQVLYDKVFQVNPNAFAMTSTDVYYPTVEKLIKINLKCRKGASLVKAVGNGSTDIQKGALWMLMGTNHAGGSAIANSRVNIVM